MKCTKAVVLSSGGVDSTTCLSIAVNDYGAENVSTLSIQYGQKHKRELDCAEAVANYYGVKHYVLDLSEIFKLSNCSLLSSSDEDVPLGSYEVQKNRSSDGVVSTFVPFRNGLFLSAATSFAMSLYPDDCVELFIGNHADDAAGNAYPDCSVEFTLAMFKAVDEGTGHRVNLYAPFAGKPKSNVVKSGLYYKTPYHLTTSCYLGGEKACGKCGTCIDRLNAFAANGVEDPIEYEVR